MKKIYPFKFLDAYTREDSKIFFGRDDEIAALYDMVFQTDILLVYGFSGTGKTSLIQCGLASKFETHDWLALPIRRGANLNESFIKVIEEAAKGQEAEADDLDWLEQDWNSDEDVAVTTKNLNPIEQAFKNIYLKYFRPIFLIFDQFEELYILGTQEEQARFVQTVKEILQVEQPVKMIFSVREEYLGYLYEFEKEVPELLRKKLRVEPMNLNKVRSIVQSLDTFEGDNIDIKKGEVQAVADAVFAKIRGEEKTLSVQLPYLQVFLDKLYLQITNDESRQAEAEFSVAAINRMGDIANVLRDFLEEQVIRIAHTTRQTTDVIWEILSPFVTLEGTKAPLSESELKHKLPDKTPQLLNKCVEAFIKSRILRYSENEEMYEIAHDSLAVQIAEKRSDEEIAILEIQRLIKSQVLLNEGARELFSEKQLNFMEPYLPRFTQTPKEAAWIQKSREEVEARKAAELQRQQAEAEQLRAQIRKDKRLKQRALLLVFLGILALGALIASHQAYNAKTDAMLAAKKARKAEQTANTKAKAATFAKKAADEKRKEALQEQAKALTAAEVAKAEQVTALRSAALARAAEARAEEERARAEDKTEIARKRLQLADDKTVIAKRQASAATKAMNAAKNLKKTIIAEKMGLRSVQITDPTEQALVAQQAYNMYEKASGSGTQNPAIYDGLYYAIKRLSDPNHYQLKGHFKAVNALEPTYGNYVYSTGNDGSIRKCNLNADLAKGQDISSIVNTGQLNWSLSLSPSARVMASSSNSPIIRLYKVDVAGNLALQSKINTRQPEVLKVVMASNAHLYALGANGEVTYWQQNNGVWTSEAIASDKATVMTANHQKVAWSKGADVLMYNNRMTKKIYSLSVNSHDKITSATLSKDGRWLAAGTQSGFLYLWDVSKQEPVSKNTQNTLPHHLARISDIAFNYVGNGKATLIATASWDKSVRLYELDNMNKEPIVFKDHKDWVNTICFSGDGAKLLAGQENGVIRGWHTTVEAMKNAIEQTNRVHRNMSVQEWNRYVGKDINYEHTFLKLPDGKGVKYEDKHREDKK